MQRGASCLPVAGDTQVDFPRVPLLLGGTGTAFMIHLVKTQTTFRLRSGGVTFLREAHRKPLSLAEPSRPRPRSSHEPRLDQLLCLGHRPRDEAAPSVWAPWSRRRTFIKNAPSRAKSGPEVGPPNTGCGTRRADRARLPGPTGHLWTQRRTMTHGLCSQGLGPARETDTVHRDHVSEGARCCGAETSGNTAWRR